MAALGIGGWLARAEIIARVENGLVHRLAERGIYLHYASRSWSPWRGLRLESVVLEREGTGHHPIVEISAITFGMPLTEMFESRTFISRWRTKDATITLHDDAGSIDFQHVTSQIIVRTTQVEIPRLDAQTGAVAFALSGKVLVTAGPDEALPPPGPFVLDLSVVRATLAALAFRSGLPLFTIRGACSVDLRDEKTVTWQANLTGTGRGVEWQGLPIRDADVRAELSSAGMTLAARLQLTTGSANVAVSRSDWDTAPRLITGTLTDAAGKTDEFSARYEEASQTLTIGDLHGKAHLLEYFRNFPMLGTFLPVPMHIDRFPDLAVKDFAWAFGPKAEHLLRIGSIQARGPADVVLSVDGHPLKIGAMDGLISYAKDTWKVQFKSGPVTWRDLAARESHVDIALAGTALKGTLALQLANGSVAFAGSGEDGPQGNLQFTGSLTDAHKQVDHFSGNYRPTTSSLHLAQLTGKANLLEFMANIPGLTASLPKTVQIRAFPEIAVKDFTYRAGKFPTVGSLQMVSPADVTVTFQEHPVAIDHLTGQIGFDGETWQLSHLGGRVFDGQWTIDGAYAGGTLRRANVTASNLHLAQLKPWLGESQGSLGEAVLAFDYHGAIGANPAEISGAGSLRLENAPLVKVPLLDQTYALFSALVSPVQRHGIGRLEATFSATKGLATVSHFTATSDAMKVTASGTLDLKQRKVAAKARANFRGVVGVATSLLSRTLEMQVSGPLDNVRVRPIGFEGVVEGTANLVPNTVKQASRVTGDIVRDGVALPVRALDLFRSDKDKEKEKPPAGR